MRNIITSLILITVFSLSFASIDVVSVITNSSSYNPGDIILVKANVTNSSENIDKVNLTCFGPGSKLNDTDSWDHLTNTSMTPETSGSGWVLYNGTVQTYHQSINGTWNCTVQANGTAGNTSQNSTNSSMSTRISIILSSTIFSFNKGNPGDNDIPYEINITHDGNVDLNLSINGTDLIGPTNLVGVTTIGVGNLTYNWSSGSAPSLPGTQLSTTLTSFLSNWDRGNNTTLTPSAINFTTWLDFPLPLRAGSYSGNITINVTIS